MISDFLSFVFGIILFGLFGKQVKKGIDVVDYGLDKGVQRINKLGEDK